MKNKLLIISPHIPYDKVPHAGGKTHNYYFKRFLEDIDFDVKLITFASENESKYIKNNSNINAIIYSNKKLEKIKRAILNINCRFNIFDKNAGIVPGYFRINIIKKLKKLKSEGYNPNFIILEWTNTVLIIERIKKIFPNSKIIASEHDVSYLGFERNLKLNNTFKNKVKYRKIYKAEVKALKRCDLVVTHNVKDYNLLKNYITKLDYISPYYDNYKDVKIKGDSKNILFFGDMRRVENYESCIWFIENVFKKLILIDKEFKFYIVGNKPHKKLFKYNNNENIIITGFVDDVKPYFEQSLCMVAPLILGAGIKVKVLEAMSSGLVVLTNKIGIEGIPAKPNEHYIHCEYYDDYLNEIISLSKDKGKGKNIGTKAQEYLSVNFTLDSSYNKLRNNILNL